MFKHWLWLVLIAVQLDARYHMITSQKSFEDLVNRYPYAVVCFSPSKSDDKSLDRDAKREVRDDFRALGGRLRSASKSDKFERYLRGKVGFLLIDTAANRAKEIDDELDLDAFPTCLLFKQGKAMLGYTQIFNPISKYSILSLLEKHFEEDFETLIAEKKKEEQLDREERIARYDAYARYGYPYGYYGWGYGPHWHYPRFGWYGHYGYRGCW